MRPLLLLFVLLLMCSPAQAQTDDSIYDVVHRPPGLRYMVLATPHFEIIFQEGLEEEAREAAHWMEASMPRLRELIGHNRRFAVPVILTGYSDMGQGFMSVAPFRIEMGAAPLRSKALSPRHRSWMALVAPHELAHAVHADMDPGGIGRLFRPFTPDLSRAINMTAPGGIIEGLAVYHESELEPDAGRLNHAFTRMQYEAAMITAPWNLTQVLENPEYTRPFDRHYSGGSFFFDYLAQREGEEFFRRAARLHYRIPVLGYGLTLWHGTGEPFWQLGNSFQQDERARIGARLAARAPLDEPVPIVDRTGLEVRRPRYAADGSMIVFARGYEVRPGFYRVDRESGELAVVAYNALTEDLWTHLTPDSLGLVFSRYETDLTVAHRQRAYVYRRDLQGGREQRLSATHGLHSAVPLRQGGYLVAQIQGQNTRLARMAEDGTLEHLEHPQMHVMTMTAMPGGDEVAAVANVAGTQGLFRLTPAGSGYAIEPWLLSANASIYEAEWSPDARHVVFTADLDGVMNIFALQVDGGRLTQLTNVPFGAMEPAVSPDGATLTFVEYRHERFRLVEMPFAPETGSEVAPAAWGDAGDWVERAAAVPRYSPDTGIRPYRASDYLWPRIAAPTVHLRNDTQEPVDPVLGIGAGLSVEGIDPLRTWRYSAGAFYQARRLWGEATVQTGASFLRPFVTAYNRPFGAQRAIVDGDTGAVIDTEDVAVQERGLGAGIATPFVFRSNVYHSTAFIRLQSEFRQTRVIESDGRPEDDGAFRNRLTLRPAASLGIGLQANPRDLVPNSGLVLTSSVLYDVLTRDVTPSRAMMSRAYLFLPVLDRVNTGVRLDAGITTRGEGLGFNLFQFMPRGLANVALGMGTYYRVGTEVTRPLWFADDGLTIIPIYLKAFYTYGFGEYLGAVSGTPTNLASVGGGVGVQLRVFYVGQLDLRFGGAIPLTGGRPRFVGR
jgi:hypothetical protein